eukprot:CAMPEP_0170335112 /NCGR_PEP_ID=MMETSP0116_2-20130129/68595_1 /TAXON_ID=400756 /ORGANISM="Durinskia baltica, Strain CSIRO CS-38" /LENGTH=237 /DNA_ID=CAMNT_0010588493 /DNA_START=30 /DNA_END=741 /DNA_ORIENTATION=+
MIRRGSVKNLIADQLQNLYTIFKLFMNVIVVDKVLKHNMDAEAAQHRCRNDFPHRRLAHPCLQEAAVARCRREQESASAGPAQQVRRFEGGVRSQVNLSGIIMAVTRDVPRIVEDGYLQLFNAMRAFGYVVLLIAYQIAAAYFFDRPVNFFGVVLPLLIYPLFSSAFLYLRKRRSIEILHDMRKSQDEMVSCLDVVVQTLPLIQEYDVAEFFMLRYEQAINDFNNQAIRAGELMVSS